MSSREEVLAAVEHSDVELIRFLYVDNEGVVRGYATHRDELAGDLESGHAMASAMPFFTAFDHLVPGTRFGCAGELRAVPDPSTFRVLPYARRTAAMICEFRTLDLQPSDVDARTKLRRVLADAGCEFRASFEPEFYLLRRDEQGRLQPFDESLCFATEGHNAAEAVIHELIAALRAQGIAVQKYYPEYGPGQHEMSYRPAEALRAADNHVFFRETVRAVAARHGLVATFMPKPLNGLAGSGCHINLSAWDGDRNLFFDPDDPLGISRFAYHFIGGVLKHARALTAFTAPTVTSYKRMVPHAWAGAYAAYGLDNRECAVRVPSGQKGREHRSSRIELKAADGASNPYLALAALIAAGMDGVRNEMHPGDPLDVDPADLSEAERAGRGIRPLPRSLAEALDELEKDELYWNTFGSTFMEEYILMKRHDWSEYVQHVTDWEVERYVRAF